MSDAPNLLSAHLQSNDITSISSVSLSFILVSLREKARQSWGAQESLLSLAGLVNASLAGLSHREVPCWNVSLRPFSLSVTPWIIWTHANHAPKIVVTGQEDGKGPQVTAFWQSISNSMEKPCAICRRCGQQRDALSGLPDLCAVLEAVHQGYGCPGWRHSAFPFHSSQEPQSVPEEHPQLWPNWEQIFSVVFFERSISLNISDIPKEPIALSP